MVSLRQRNLPPQMLETTGLSLLRLFCQRYLRRSWLGSSLNFWKVTVCFFLLISRIVGTWVHVMSCSQYLTIYTQLALDEGYGGKASFPLPKLHCIYGTNFLYNWCCNIFANDRRAFHWKSIQTISFLILNQQFLWRNHFCSPGIYSTQLKIFLLI